MLIRSRNPNRLIIKAVIAMAKAAALFLPLKSGIFSADFITDVKTPTEAPNIAVNRPAAQITNKKGEMPPASTKSGRSPATDSGWKSIAHISPDDTENSIIKQTAELKTKSFFPFKIFPDELTVPTEHKKLYAAYTVEETGKLFKKAFFSADKGKVDIIRFLSYKTESKTVTVAHTIIIGTITENSFEVQLNPFEEIMAAVTEKTNEKINSNADFERNDPNKDVAPAVITVKIQKQKDDSQILTVLYSISLLNGIIICATSFSFPKCEIYAVIYTRSDNIKQESISPIIPLLPKQPKNCHNSLPDIRPAPKKHPTVENDNFKVLFFIKIPPFEGIKPQKLMLIIMLFNFYLLVLFFEKQRAGKM